VIAVHVLTPNQELARDFSFEMNHTWRRDLESQLRGPWVEPLSRSNVPYRCLLVERDTLAGGLLQVATDRGADLVAVGAKRSRRGFGSTSQKLSQGAGCPVVVVPPDWHSATAT